ncbi:MAG: hypothetical protein ACK4KW_12530 [Gemmobacter sp.]
MKLDQLINMFTRMITRRLMNAGIRKGTGMLARTGGGGGTAPKGQARSGPDGAPMTPAQRAQADKLRQAAKQARKAARITRRMGR